MPILPLAATGRLHAASGRHYSSPHWIALDNSFRSVKALDKDGCFQVARVALSAAVRDAYRSWHDFCVTNHVHFEGGRAGSIHPSKSEMLL